MSNRPLDWSLQQTFLEVMRDRSLSGAARRLALTQPTVGRQIDALEVGTDEDTEIDALARIAKFTRMIPTVYLPTHDPLSADRLLQRRYVTHA